MTTAKVISIRGGAAAPHEPNKEVIGLLRKYLEQAERGEIDAVAIAASRPNDTIVSAYEFGLSSFRLCAAVMWLHRSITDCLDCVSREVSDDS